MPVKVMNPTDKYVGSRVRMRRLMLGMSQEALADQLGLTFQQVQKYEKGVNRISASRVQHMCHILQVPVPFFFDGAPQIEGHSGKGTEVPSPAYVSDFLATSDGLALVKAFMRIGDSELRRCIVRLVEEIVGDAVSRDNRRLCGNGAGCREGAGSFFGAQSGGGLQGGK